MAKVPSPAEDIAAPSPTLRWLRVSLVAGALYDLFFAALMVLAPQLPERLLGLPRPGEDYYLWLIATFLTMLAAFYVLAAADPFAYRGNILVAIGGRTVGGLALLAAAFEPGLGGLFPLAGGDLFFAVAHALLWLPNRRLLEQGRPLRP